MLFHGGVIISTRLPHYRPFVWEIIAQTASDADVCLFFVGPHKLLYKRLEWPVKWDALIFMWRYLYNIMLVCIPSSGTGVEVTKPFLSFPLFLLFARSTKTLDTCIKSCSYLTELRRHLDIKYLTYIFAKSKFPVMEQLTNGASLTPIPATCTSQQSLLFPSPA